METETETEIENASLVPIERLQNRYTTLRCHLRPMMARLGCFFMKCLHSQFPKLIPLVERQKGLTTCVLHTQLDLFATKLII